MLNLEVLKCLKLRERERQRDVVQQLRQAQAFIGLSPLSESHFGPGLTCTLNAVSALKPMRALKTHWDANSIASDAHSSSN